MSELESGLVFLVFGRVCELFYMIDKLKYIRNEISIIKNSLGDRGN